MSNKLIVEITFSYARRRLTFIYSDNSQRGYIGPIAILKARQLWTFKKLQD